MPLNIKYHHLFLFPSVWIGRVLRLEPGPYYLPIPLFPFESMIRLRIWAKSWSAYMPERNLSQTLCQNTELTNLSKTHESTKKRHTGHTFNNSKSSQLQLQAWYYCVSHLKVVSCIVMAAWKLRTVCWQQIFRILALMMFLLFSFQKVLQNRRFSAVASRSGFGAANCCHLWSRVEQLSLLRFATQCLQIAVEWLRQGSSQLQLQA